MLDKVQTFLDISSEQLLPVVPLEEYNLLLSSKEILCMAVPAYNVNKKSPQGNLYHDKEKGYVGYVLSINSVTVYFVADSDPIPEMDALVGVVDVLLLPISGVYVMNIDEAIELTVRIHPQVVFPMHYGAIVGDSTLGEQFKQQLAEIAPNITVVL
jgi:L-ascorbate metabolism protein UlaG (beta-lactamase superfamily)